MFVEGGEREIMKVPRKDHKTALEIEKLKCEQIYELLKQHKGKAKAITTRKISEIVKLPIKDTQVQCRTYVSKVMDMFEVPIVSCSKGYYIAATEDEMNAYMSSMNKRIAGIQKTMDKAWNYFEKSRNTED